MSCPTFTMSGFLSSGGLGSATWSESSGIGARVFAVEGNTAMKSALPQISRAKLCASMSAPMQHPCEKIIIRFLCSRNQSASCRACQRVIPYIEPVNETLKSVVLHDHLAELADPASSEVVATDRRPTRGAFGHRQILAGVAGHCALAPHFASTCFGFCPIGIASASCLPRL